MTTFEKIRKTKSGIKLSQSLNIPYELYLLYEELIKRPNDKFFQANIFIQIVASNESFFKETIASLINFNEKFLENSKSIVKRVGFKFELEDILNISKSTISLGDLIAFSLKYSSIESVLKTLNEISELDILNQIIEIESNLIDNDEEPLLISKERPFDKNRIIKNLKETYEIRNIICHDFLSATHKLTFNFENIKHYLLDTILLQESIIFLLSEKAYSKYVPLDHKKRLIYYQNILEQKENELTNLNSITTKNLEIERLKLFEKANKEFIKYLNADCLFWNGSDPIFPDLLLENKISLIDQRINYLKNEINNSE